jgi:rare lipoprotein A (peptidoglycan hydrolase)
MKNWKEMPFFQSIEKEQKEDAIFYGRKFNLNLSGKGNIFDLSAETALEI